MNLDELCDDDSTITGKCDNCDWSQAGQGVTEIHAVLLAGNDHMEQARHMVHLDVLA